MPYQQQKLRNDNNFFLQKEILHGCYIHTKFLSAVHSSFFLAFFLHSSGSIVFGRTLYRAFLKKVLHKREEKTQEKIKMTLQKDKNLAFYSNFFFFLGNQEGPKNTN